MVFELYIQHMDATGLEGMPREQVRARFPIVEEESERDCWRVRYDAATAFEIETTPSTTNPEVLTSFYVGRPPLKIPFWEAVLSVLRMGPIVLYVPGRPPVVADKATSDSLAEEIVKTLGPPQCAGSAQEIVDILGE